MSENENVSLSDYIQMRLEQDMERLGGYFCKISPSALDLAKNQDLQTEREMMGAQARRKKAKPRYRVKAISVPWP